MGFSCMAAPSFGSCSPTPLHCLSDDSPPLVSKTPHLNKSLGELFKSLVEASTKKRPRRSDPPRTESMQEEGLAHHSAQQGTPTMGTTALTGALPPVFHKLLPTLLPSLFGVRHPARRVLRAVSCCIQSTKCVHVQREGQTGLPTTTTSPPRKQLCPLHDSRGKT